MIDLTHFVKRFFDAMPEVDFPVLFLIFQIKMSAIYKRNDSSNSSERERERDAEGKRQINKSLHRIKFAGRSNMILLFLVC